MSWTIDDKIGFEYHQLHKLKEKQRDLTKQEIEHKEKIDYLKKEKAKRK